MEKILSLVRRCAEDYEMLAPGDRVAVGVSGWKDSLVLLLALARLRTFYPIPFTVEAVTLDLGGGADYAPIAALCQREGIPYTLIPTEIQHIIFDLRREKNPCSMCAKMRRGALNNAILELGCNKVALGHHYDDAVETFIMSLLFEGRISCFQPVTYLDKTGVTQIRPMLYIPEKTLDNFAARMALPVLVNRCPADKHTKREEVKELVFSLSATYPDLKERVFGAMQRFPLPAWETKGRYNRPKPE